MALRSARARWYVAGSLALASLTLSGAGDPPAGGPELADERPTTPAGKAAAPSYPRSGYAWPFASGPHYGVEPVGDGTPRLLTAVGTLRLDRPLPFPEALRKSGDPGRAAGYFIVQQLDRSAWNREGVLGPARAIRRTGGDVLQALPGAAMLVRLTPAGQAALRDGPGRWAVVPYHPAFKLDPTIGRQPLSDPARALSDVYALEVRLHRGEDASVAAASIERFGGRVLRRWNDRLRIELAASRLADLAGLDAVQRIHEALPQRPWDAQISGAVQIGSATSGQPFHAAGLRGAGQVLMVLDSGIQLDAADLSDTSTVPGTPGPSHRKVRFYGSVEAFGGTGDDRGCDATPSGGFTHGHVVAAVALGNPTHADTTLAATDAAGSSWGLEGVAPDASLVAYDAHVTPAVGGCADSLAGLLDVGELYAAPDGGSLGEAYSMHGARVFNLAWGSGLDAYSINGEDVDRFAFDHPEALVLIAAGNRGADENRDGIPDPATIGEPATAKNALVIGSHGGADDFHDPGNIDERSVFSGSGPVAGTPRVAPVLMAPGQERGTTGTAVAFACRSGDNDSVGAVLCDVVSNRSGTSIASGAAAGSALLVRDYFASGFHPDGTSANPGNDADRVPTVSGSLVKATLIASARFLGRDFNGLYAANNDNLRLRSRFNNEQGYGRIQLDRALPLASRSGGPAGLLIVDGGVPGGIADLPGLSGGLDAVGGASESATFEVCDDAQELRVALAWTDDPGAFLVNDLDLTLTAPDGTEYFGNLFTDDDDGDGVVDPLTEDCPSRFDDGTPLDNGWDRSEWSLATCTRPGDGTPPSKPPRDDANPTEAIFLSPNPEDRRNVSGEPILRGGTCDDAAADPCGYAGHCAPGVACVNGTSQVQAGTWTVEVAADSGGSNPAQGYALVIAGGVCSGSTVALDRPAYRCRDRATLVVHERDEAADPGAELTAEVVASRITVEVLDAGGTVLDAEAGSDLGFARDPAGSLRFVALEVPLTDGTTPDPGNGVLDVRDGNVVRLSYADAPGDPDSVRIAGAEIGCRPAILGGAVKISQFGTDVPWLVQGGCERNARGWFEFGFPDRYLDAGETVAYRVAFASTEATDLADVRAELSCVEVDADSPPGCAPDSDDCPDPERANNPPCGALRILDPVRHLGLVAARAAVSANFQLQIARWLSGTPEVELILGITGDGGGRPAAARIVNRHRLNVDEVSKHYSTDFPQGGTLLLDRNNNGRIESPSTSGVGGFPTLDNTDYVFEAVQYSDLTAGLDASGDPVTVNTGLSSPWHFDTSDGGFTSGISGDTDESTIVETIAQWGEDKNFNRGLDGECASRPGVRCDWFPNDPLRCSFCEDSGAPCVSDLDCGGARCDATCNHLEDRDPVNLPVPLLDQNWSTRGGCGWQTRAPGTCSGDASRGCYNDGDCSGVGSCSGPAQATGGIWHTGRIDHPTELNCAVTGNGNGQCQVYEVIGGIDGERSRLELLVTPEISKVDQRVDGFGRPLATAEIVQWRWNQAIDLADGNVSVTVELDPDLDALEPVDLTADSTVLTTLTGDYGAINRGGNPVLTRGWGLFAPIDPATGETRNGSVGNNRVGRNACVFEGGALLPEAFEFVYDGLPPDDDLLEGYCPSGGGLGGLDPHLEYCTRVCSEATDLPCGNDAACQGVCVNSAFCSNRPGVDCLVDQDCDFGTCVDVVCNGTCTDGRCSNDAREICGDDADCTTECVFPDAEIDNFVTPAGPVRGFELGDWHGPDMRFNTLADVAGPVGNRFAGAIGFHNREAPYGPEAVAGYGVGIDDVVLEWREFTLEEDVSECRPRCVGPASPVACDDDDDCPGGACGGGSCATLNLDANNLFEGSLRLGLSLVDPFPSANDCDGDGQTDATRDCDRNRVPDVVVVVDSPQEPDGERVVLNAVPGSTTVFRGSLAVSSSFDVPGTLFVATLGNDPPTIRATYLDLDDGTGRPCGNSVDPSQHGRVQSEATVFLDARPIWVTRGRVEDNGDQDGWADTGETVRLAVELSNKPSRRANPGSDFGFTGGVDATGVRVHLTSDDPAIRCITRSTIAFGDLPVGQTRFGEETFELIVSPDIERTDPMQILRATVQLTVEANEFQSLTSPQTLTFDLDLDAVGGGDPTTFFESFEGGFGSFTTMHLDEHLNPPSSDLNNIQQGVIVADGFRCQYSDPDWEGSASHGNSQGRQCFPNPNGAEDAYYFHIVTDRAFSGAQSLGFNVALDPALGYTSPNSQLEAIRTLDPIDLAWDRVCTGNPNSSCATDGDCPNGTCEFATPELSFKHQISQLDHRSVGAQFGRAADRGVVHVQLADAAGTPSGPWIKAYPFVNLYDSQANSNYFNCTFDPADDGNTEEDFFDPSDPLRSLGPSSTCAPEFSFVHQGNTEGLPGQGSLGDTSDGPGLAGELGEGTWVEPIFDLSAYRGRRIRVRFLESGLKLGTALTWEQAFQFNPDPRDDGWFIDDVTVTGALTAPATLSADVKDNSHLPTCDDVFCGLSGGVQASVSVSPGTAPRTPGEPVTLDASATTVDICRNGVLQYRFWLEVDDAVAYSPPIDLLLRDWTDNPVFTDAPLGATSYGVEVRCATEPSCSDIAIVTVAPGCPASGSLMEVETGNAFLHRLPPERRPIRLDATRNGADKTVHVHWTTAALVDAVRGDLPALRSPGGVGGSETCVLDDATGITEWVDSTPTPATGDGLFWLLRSAAACNQPAAGGSWGAVGEAVPRVIGACPD